MTVWAPVYRVKVNGTDVTGTTLTGLSINKGRQDVNSTVNSSYCQLTLVNYENTIYPFQINSTLTIEVKNSAGSYVFIYAGRISDLATTVQTAGSIKTITTIQISAVGSMTRMGRAIYNGSLSEDTDGNQIKTLLYSIGADQWNEVGAAVAWNTYSPATDTWNDVNAFVGEFDPGVYTMISQTLDNSIISSTINSIAQSAGGYVYEDERGLVSYADANHRASLLTTAGYTVLDANTALYSGIATVTRQGDVINKYTIRHGANFTSSHTSENTASQATYGLYGSVLNSYMKNSADVIDFADRTINLRAYPYDQFQSITFPIQNSEIGDTQRDALLGLYMGMPVRITNLPANISQGQFSGFLEGWSYRSTPNGLTVTLNASPTNFSAISQRWEQVNVAESWNTINTSLKWEYAIGVIA